MKLNIIYVIPSGGEAIKGIFFETFEARGE
jgi:hypothetical protein